MNNDNAWSKLLAQSAPTFAADAAPPYGFTTSTMALLRAERLQAREFERIGWRAMLAALGALAITATVTVAVDIRDRNADLDPGVRSLVQVDSLPFS